MRRLYLIEQEEDQSKSAEWDDDSVVLHVNRKGTPPFMMKGKISNTPFKTMIDSESPITLFTQGEVRLLLKSDLLFVGR